MRYAKVPVPGHAAPGKADGHPLTIQNTRELSCRRGCGGLEAIVLQRGRHQLEHRHQTVFGGKCAAPNEILQPCTSPNYAIKQLIQGGLGSVPHLQSNRPAELVVNHQWVDHGIVPPAANFVPEFVPLYHPSSLRHRGLGGGQQPRTTSAAFWPPRLGSVRASVGGAEEDDPLNHVGEHPALDL